MDSFDDKYWNLAQAATWVVYREKELVTRFEQPTGKDLARLLARQAAAEAILATKVAGPDQSSPNQLDEDRYNGATIRKPPDN